jgi:hypothetical protein
MEIEAAEEQVAILDAIHRLGVLYADQGNMAEAEKIYKRLKRTQAQEVGGGVQSNVLKS